MRLVDADALKDNMFHYAAPEMVWDRGDIEHKINEMPTIDAIPVNWINAYMNKAYGRVRAEIIREMLDAWMEQEAR